MFFIGADFMLFFLVLISLVLFVDVMLPILGHLNELMGLKLCCRIEPRKEENPTYEYEDNSGVTEKKGSTNNNIVKIILAVVAAFLATGGGLYVAFSCYTYISYSTNHGWNFGLSAGIRSRWPQFCS
jgi:hypothetical protein